MSVHFLSWREVDFAGVAVTGLIAGYVMALAGLWAGRVPGLVAIDIADYGRRYMVSDRPSAWFLGLLSHLANSILLTLLWASAIVCNVAGPRWLVGAVYGLVLGVVLAGILVAPMAGLGLLGRRTRSGRFIATNLLVHLAWGLLVGIIYVPR